MLKNVRKRMNMTIFNYCMSFLFISVKNVVDYIAVGNRCRPPTFNLSQMMLKMMSSHILGPAYLVASLMSWYLLYVTQHS